jgi:hypothetical protein
MVGMETKALTTAMGQWALSSFLLAVYLIRLATAGTKNV